MSPAPSTPQLVEMVGKLEQEVVNLRCQAAWFQRQIFGQKSEKRLPEPSPLSADFDAIPDTVCIPVNVTADSGLS